MSTWKTLTTTPNQSSKYMSDELCYAILDYNDLIASKDGQFNDLLTQKETLQETLTTKQNEMDTLQTELAIIQDTLDVQKANTNLYNYYTVTYNGQGENKDFTLDASEKYAVMMKVSSTANITVKFDSVNYTLNADNTWQVVKKIANADTINLTTITSTNVTLTMYIVSITQTEYDTTGNDSDILNKYNDDYKQDQIDAKQLEIDDVNNQISQVDASITSLQNEISIENNFTPEQIKERNKYIIESTWSDSNYIDDKELYEDAKKHFIELKQPKTTFELDIVDFLEVIDEQYNWDKLVVGDEINIRYEKLGVNIKAKITEIHINYDQQTISLSIANVKDLFGDASNLLKVLKESTSTSITLDMSKYKYDDTVQKTTEMNDLLNSTWDAAKRRITAGAKESVDISNRGIIIKNPDFENEVIILQSGIMALSDDFGKNWKTAITAKGIIAELLMGKVIAGQNLIIESSTGKFTFDDNGATIDGTTFKLTGGTNGVEIDPNGGLIVTKNNNTNRVILNATDGIKVQSSVDNGVTWTDLFYIDTNGNLNMVGKFSMTGGQFDGDSNFYWDSKGFYAVDSTNPNNIVKISSSGILLSTDGGKTYSTAITGTGISASLIKVGQMLFDRIQGGTLTLGGSNNGNGVLRVLDANGEVIAELNASTGGFDWLRIGDVISDSVVKVLNQPLTYYVDPINGSDISNDGSSSSPFKTLQKAINKMPKYLDADATINLVIGTTFNINENLEIYGFNGQGNLTIECQNKSNTINGDLDIKSCTSRIYVNNATLNFANSSLDSVVRAFESSSVYLTNITLYGRNTCRWGIQCYSGFVRAINVEVYNVTERCFTADYGGRIYNQNCKGLAPYGLYAYGGLIVGEGTAPSGSTANSATGSGGDIRGTFSFDSGAATPPPSPDTTSTWSSTSADNWSSSGFWSGDGVKQGNYGYGRRTGYWFFGSSPSSTVTGKTIKRMRVYIKRLSKGGANGDVTIYLRWHTYASKPSSAGNMAGMGTETQTVALSWGDSGWVELPSTFYNDFSGGSAKGIGVYVDSDSSSYYAILDSSAKLEITYA